MMSADDRPGAGDRSTDQSLEAPEVDTIEQGQPVLPEDGGDDVVDVPFEASAPDVADQRREVVLDDELRADDPTISGLQEPD